MVHAEKRNASILECLASAKPASMLGAHRQLTGRRDRREPASCRLQSRTRVVRSESSGCALKRVCSHAGLEMIRHCVVWQLQQEQQPCKWRFPSLLFLVPNGAVRACGGALFKTSRSGRRAGGFVDFLDEGAAVLDRAYGGQHCSAFSSLEGATRQARNFLSVVVSVVLCLPQ